MPRVPLGITEESLHRNGVLLASKGDFKIAWHVDICAVSTHPIDVLVMLVVALSEAISKVWVILSVNKVNEHIP